MQLQKESVPRFFIYQSSCISWDNSDKYPTYLLLPSQEQSYLYYLSESYYDTWVSFNSNLGIITIFDSIGKL